MNNIKLSIIICTYNRSRLLKKCLDSLLPQILEGIEIIIIDNLSSDDTNQVVSEYTSKYINIRYFFEPITGLSHARNRCIKEAKADWILYLDDDVIVFDDFIERALYLTTLDQFDCIGGNYIGYVEKNRPKWLPKDFESYKGNITDLSECDYNIPIGCNVLYKKQALISVGKFDPSFGMKGHQTGYSDETELQFRLKKFGYKIGFDPLLKVYHVIRDDKFKLSWHLKSGFAHGRDGEKTNKNYHIFGTIMLFFKSGAALLYKIPLSLLKVLFIKTYYWQNAILDSFWPIFYRWGQVKSKLL
jgi:glycosyltransferase involved in cell wall biosynthesis